jgi:hypothetical protein
MVTYQDLNLISSELEEIPQMAKLCQETVNALLEANECCIRDNIVLSLLLFPTDYNRARKQIIAKCASAERRLQDVRRSIISPEAIRAVSHISRIKKLCASCEKINKTNLQQGKKFSCQIQEKYGQVSVKEFRFELDQIGRIIEKL